MLTACFTVQVMHAVVGFLAWPLHTSNSTGALLCFKGCPFHKEASFYCNQFCSHLHGCQKLRTKRLLLEYWHG
jgi:hypothetical protein